MSEPHIQKIAIDCRYFLGDRPCLWHKLDGFVCECEHYSPLKGHIAVIKLDAMGDVLRTTCILPCIAEKWQGMGITWITKHESVPLLENNPYINEIVPYGADALVHLKARTFDYVINLDAGKISAGLAAIVKSPDKIGYVLSENGYVTATNENAHEWLKMGINDKLKKENKRTYQHIMCGILGLKTGAMKYVLLLSETEIEEGKRHLMTLGLNLSKSIIGIHTGGGGRWTLKQWNKEKFIKLISELLSHYGREIQILLLGGPLEREINKMIRDELNIAVFDSGCDNEVRHVASLINNCSVLLSGDSLAMHLALAMGSRVVVLFGPTSNTEIELFGLGEKVIPNLDCISCYKKKCDFNPNCMDSISVEMVQKAILRQLDIAIRHRRKTL